MNFRIILLLFWVAAKVQAQEANNPPTEMRGAWIATVNNIDWPPAPSGGDEKQEFDSNLQKMAFLELLDSLKALNFNAIFVQVRSCGDAFYASEVVPWSSFLTGTQGKAPEPFYDPLEFMVRAAHQRHLEIHAWMNPYRASMNLDTQALSPNHPLRALPDDAKRDWFFQYGNRYYFNPASPFVRQHLQNVVREVVTRYDIDGIHFDDYFYPYPIKDAEIDDQEAFKLNPGKFKHLEDWRRNNVNQLIKGVGSLIKKNKPFVRFGISPFGIWRNSTTDPQGSETRAGIQGYDDLYADVRLWLKNGWIDYVAPQLYWSIGYKPADYEKLVDWWAEQSNGRHLYIGQAAYKIDVDKNDPNWKEPGQIGAQIVLNRANSTVKGSIMYSAGKLLGNPLGVMDTLRENYYKQYLLTPPLDFLKVPQAATARFAQTSGTKTAIRLSWTLENMPDGTEIPYFYAIYRFPGEKTGDTSNPDNRIYLSPYHDENLVFLDKTARKGQKYTYVVQGYNRANQPGAFSQPLLLKKTGRGVNVKRKFWGYLLPASWF
jgi:uncharacterized lipoprotein YddW (UPF0748 family)